MQHRPSLVMPWLTLAAIVGTFAVNIWSNLSPPNGQTIGDISNTLFANVLIIPANYAFAIWGLIYLGLFGFGIYQLLPAQRTNPKLQSIRPLLIFACIAQAIWVFLFLEQQFWTSVVAMLGILLPLIAIYLRLKSAQRIDRAEKWLAQIPFGIYLGWISVATVVNLAIALFNQGWNGWGVAPPVWTVIMMAVAAALAVALNLQYREVAYPLVIVWALVAVASRQSGIPLIVGTAAALAIALSVLALIKMVSKYDVSHT